jgi:hypothetical protein
MTDASPVSGLFTDLYELSMMQAYVEEDMDDQAVFSLTVRRLPGTRNYLLACGIGTVLAGPPYAEHRLVASTGPSGTGPADVHNLAVATCLPVVESRDLLNDLVEPPLFRRQSAVPPTMPRCPSAGTGRFSIWSSG